MAKEKEKEASRKFGNSVEKDFFQDSSFEESPFSTSPTQPTPFKIAEWLGISKKEQPYTSNGSLNRATSPNRSISHSASETSSEIFENGRTSGSGSPPKVDSHFTTAPRRPIVAEMPGKIYHQSAPSTESTKQYFSASETSSSIFDSTVSSLAGFIPGFISSRFNYRRRESDLPPNDSVFKVPHSFPPEGGELDTGTGVRLYAQRLPNHGLIAGIGGNKRDVEVQVDGRALESILLDGQIQASPTVELKWRKPRERDPSYILELPKSATINDPQQAKLEVLSSEMNENFEKVNEKNCIIQEESDSIFVRLTSSKRYTKFVVIVRLLIETAKAFGNNLPFFRPPVTYKVDFAVYGPRKIERDMAPQVYFSSKAFIPEKILSKPNFKKWEQNSIPLSYYQDLKLTANVQAEDQQWLAECPSPEIYEDELQRGELIHRGILINYQGKTSRINKFNLSVKVDAQKEGKSVSCDMTSPPPSGNNFCEHTDSYHPIFQQEGSSRKRPRKKISPTEQVVAKQDYSTPRMYLLQFKKGDIISVLGNETIRAVKDGITCEWKLGLVISENGKSEKVVQVGFYNVDHVQNTPGFNTVRVADVMSHILKFCDTLVNYELRKIQILLDRHLGWGWMDFEEFSEADIQSVITAYPRNLPDQVSDALSALHQRKGSTYFIRSLVNNLLSVKKEELAKEVVLDCIFVALARKLEGSWCNVAFRLGLNSKKQKLISKNARTEEISILECEPMEATMLEGLTMFRTWYRDTATTNSKKECLEILQNSLSACKKDKLCPYVEGALLLILCTKSIF